MALNGTLTKPRGQHGAGPAGPLRQLTWGLSAQIRDL